MREHRYTLEMPHSPARLWALFQDYDNWTAYAPMVLGSTSSIRATPTATDCCAG